MGGSCQILGLNTWRRVAITRAEFTPPPGLHVLSPKWKICKAYAKCVQLFSPGGQRDDNHLRSETKSELQKRANRGNIFLLIFPRWCYFCDITDVTGSYLCAQWAFLFLSLKNECSIRKITKHGWAMYTNIPIELIGDISKKVSQKMN